MNNADMPRPTQKAKALSMSLYPTIGEFAVKFESVCHAMRMGISMILEKAGLQDERLSDILIGDLTAFPLQNIYRALLVQTTKVTGKELKIIDSLFNGVAKLAEDRNKILHSRWSIDFKNLQDIKDELITGRKPGYSKRGAKPKSFKVPITEIRALSQRAHVLDDLIHQLNLIVYSGCSIGSYFHLSADGQAAADGTMADLLVRKGDVFVIRSKK